MQEFGDLQELYLKWWKVEGKLLECDKTNDNLEETSELGISKVAGVFLCVFTMLILSIFMSIIEFMHKLNRISKDRVSKTFFPMRKRK